MRKIKAQTTALFAAAVCTILAGTGVASAASPPVGSASISDTLAAGVYTYSITLTDTPTSPSPIGTYWFAWIPEQDYLSTAPLSVTNPAGWNDNITHGGAADGYAIQWLAASPPTGAIIPGNSLTFSFTTIDPPSSVLGNSTLFPSTPTTTSFLYSAGPFNDPGSKIIAAVPEPASLAILSPVLLLLGRRRS